eukprot:762497-Hanusia_phi.AAC.8
MRREGRRKRGSRSGNNGLATLGHCATSALYWHTPTPYVVVETTPTFNFNTGVKVGERVAEWDKEEERRRNRTGGGGGGG